MGIVVAAGVAWGSIVDSEAVGGGQARVLPESASGELQGERYSCT